MTEPGPADHGAARELVTPERLRAFFAPRSIALVGASGSGKSTVSLLLPRFYDVQEGAIRVDGIDVRDATLDSVRGEIGIVFEDAFLFSDTVRANIAYGRPEATDAEVVSVCGGDYDLGTSDGRFKARIMGNVARKESEDKARRLRRKHVQLAEQGKPNGGRRPLGYRRIGEKPRHAGDPDTRQLVIDPDEAKIVETVGKHLK